jgi:N-acetylneuraminic acid mutarotase
MDSVSYAARLTISPWHCVAGLPCRIGQLRRPRLGVAFLATLLVVASCASAQTWAQVSSMQVPRAGHQLIPLLDNRVLAIGAVDPNLIGSPTTVAEIYNPATNAWSTTAPAPFQLVGVRSVRLTDGRVLVTGGGYGYGAENHAAVFDPIAGTWTRVANMSAPRRNHTATLLSNGKVLVANGYQGFFNWINTAEIFDPTSSTWTPTGSTPTRSAKHASVLLKDGRVLLIGGENSTKNQALPTAALYDPHSGTWTATGALNIARSTLEAIVLNDGRVLVAGGTTKGAAGGPSTNQAELYDPATGKWTVAAPMSTSRAYFGMIRLANGRVLAIGGGSMSDGVYYQDAVRLSSIESYDPATNAWSQSVRLVEARSEVTVALLADGVTVLTSGGTQGTARNLTILKSVELWSECDSPRVLFSTPDRGGNTGQVTMRIVGCGFGNASFLRLTGVGADISGKNTVIDGNSLTVTFPLFGVPRGRRNIVVTTATGASLIVPAAFDVEEGGAPHLWMNVMGRTIVARDRAATFVFTIGNSGSIDIHDTVLLITLPKGVKHNLSNLIPSSITNPPGLERTGVEYGEEIVIPIWFYRLPSRSARTIALDITPSASQVGTSLQIVAHLFRPDLKGFALTGNLNEVPESVTQLIEAGGSLYKAIIVQPTIRIPASAFDSARSGQFGSCRDADWETVEFWHNCPQDAQRNTMEEVQDVSGIVSPTGVGVGLGLQGLESIHRFQKIGAGGEGLFAVFKLWKIRNALNRIEQRQQALVVGSIDPNEKIGVTGVTPKRHVSGKQPLSYTIYFENLSTATAPAQEVTITDALSLQHLDLNSLSLGPMSFGNSIIIPPYPVSEYDHIVDLRPEKDVLVDVRVRLDKSTGVLTWHFSAIDPTTGDRPTNPLVGFLPPNRQSPEGQGYVSIVVDPAQEVPTDTQIRNKATIFFDGQPLETPVWTNTIDAASPMSKVNQIINVAPQTSPTFPVTWSGADQGSGIGTYTIYVSDNNGPFTPWLTDTTATQATYTGVSGHTYRFYSIARDLVANTEPPKTAAEASTTIIVTTPPPSGTPVAPTTISVTPSSGSTATVSFSAVYSDGNGASDLTTVYLLVNNSPSAASSCFVEYNRPANTYRLINDSGTTWSNPIGSGQSFSNSQCTVSPSGTSMASGNNLTVTFPITFTSAFSGAKKVSLLAMDGAGGNSGWNERGSWTVPGAQTGQGTPSLISLAPLTGTGTTGIFTAKFAHSAGRPGHYLGYLLFLPTPNVVNYVAIGSCLIEYNSLGGAFNGKGGMRLVDDAGTAWIGPVQGVPLAPTTPALSNSACTVNVSGATATFTGNDMIVTVPVTFKTAGLTPVLGTFLQELDVNGQWTGMTQFGNWVLPGAPVKLGPAVVSLSSSQVSGTSATLTATAANSFGIGQLGMFHMLIADRVVGGTACQIVYFAFDNTVALINDAGTAFAGAGRVGLGSANQLMNSRCSLNVAAARRTVTGNDVSVTYPMTFTPATFGGVKNVYLNIFDLSGNLSHWVQGGVLTVQ